MRFLNQIFDQVAQLAARHEKLLGMLSFGWMMFTGAVYARFITLPDVPYLTDRNAWMISGPWNMLWWGFLQPRLAERKKAIEQETDEGG